MSPEFPFQPPSIQPASRDSAPLLQIEEITVAQAEVPSSLLSSLNNVFYRRKRRCIAQPVSLLAWIKQF